ncbi:MAG: hypothetical protein R3C18_26510 [Planctomycetaceae bacterium]
MPVKAKSSPEPTVAATVAGEDIVGGDYVAILTQTFDVPSYFWNGCLTSLLPEETVRLKLIPETAGLPLKVVAVCLPFIYTTTPFGQSVTLDTRRLQLVRIDKKCAKAIWRQRRAESPFNNC